jgi:hypothetical protein
MGCRLPARNLNETAANGVENVDGKPPPQR